jgi:exopolyphosphatase/guanosine-5'-triphosphate,3'-diphosphate pyrophosphatase
VLATAETSEAATAAVAETDTRESMTSKDLYAAIDLGSNSFHMLIVRPVAGAVQVLAKIKLKVRLASGLDQNNLLDKAAMNRGWECLALFAERLQDIPTRQIRIVATATLRQAANAVTFLEKAEKILDHPIDVISGEQEAQTIYQGVAHTSSGQHSRLVIDIGGASTELILGECFQTRALVSLPIGCVLYREQYFKDGLLSRENFDAAIEAADACIAPVRESYRSLGWQQCLGASGTIQAVQEIILVQYQDERITLERLEQVMAQCCACDNLSDLQIDGLQEERKPVFASGLAILVSLFRQLKIESMTTSGGALREGLVYEMLDQLPRYDARIRSIESLRKRFRIDRAQSERVSQIALTLMEQIRQESRHHCDSEAEALLSCAAQLHEIGLIIGYRNASAHGEYILGHVEMPGFSPNQQRIIARLVALARGPLPEQAFAGCNGLSHALCIQLCCLLRLAVILAGRRRDSSIPDYQLSIRENQLMLSLPRTWLDAAPLTLANLEQEAKVWTNQQMTLHLRKTE